MNREEMMKAAFFFSVGAFVMLVACVALWPHRITEKITKPYVVYQRLETGKRAEIPVPVFVERRRGRFRSAMRGKGFSQMCKGNERLCTLIKAEGVREVRHCYRTRKDPSECFENVIMTAWVVPFLDKRGYYKKLQRKR